jgi:hypothetical protein
MSRDLVPMMRSFRLVAAELRGRHPELRADIEAGEVFAARWLLGRALWARDLRTARKLAWSPEGLLPPHMLAAMAAELGSAAAAVARARVRRLAGGVVWHLRPTTTALPRQRFPMGVTPEDPGGG